MKVFHLISSQATKEERQHHPKEAEERSTTQRKGEESGTTQKEEGEAAPTPKKEGKRNHHFASSYFTACATLLCGVCVEGACSCVYVLKMCVRVLKVCGVWV